MFSSEIEAPSKGFPKTLVRNFFHRFENFERAVVNEADDESADDHFAATDSFVGRGRILIVRARSFARFRGRARFQDFGAGGAFRILQVTMLMNDEGAPCRDHHKDA